MSATRTRTKTAAQVSEYVTTNQLKATIEAMRWEIRFLVVAGLVLGQIGMRLDIGPTVKQGAVTLGRLLGIL